MTQQQPRAEPEIAPEGRHAREAPRVARAFAQHRRVAEQPAGLVLSVARVHAPVDEGLAPQLHVHPHLVGQLVVEPKTEERSDLANPPLRRVPLECPWVVLTDVRQPSAFLMTLVIA